MRRTCVSRVNDYSAYQRFIHRSEVIYLVMSPKDGFDVYVGGKTGTFTSVKLRKQDCLTKNIQDCGNAPESGEVTTVSWGNDDEREILVACGANNARSVKVYDTDCSTYTSMFFCDCGKGKITGISRYDEAILTAVRSGEVKLWRFREEDGFIIKAGENLERMRHSRVNKNIIATGGQESELRLFDISKQQQTFVEKNLPHDWLQLRVPIWISDIGFLPDTEHVVTVSRYGHVRLYDPKTQRRPVINLEMKDEALTTLAVTPRERQVIVGTGKGKMNLVDLRSPAKALNTYKGFAGGVTGIGCSKIGPYVVSVSLDRYLRVHHIDTKQVLKKVYLTSKPSCMVLRSGFSLPTENETEEEETVRRSDSDVKPGTEGNDLEYDMLFDSMQTIGSKENGTSPERKKKRTRMDREIVSTGEPVRRKAGETVSNCKKTKKK